jgi:hypothetical protein
MEYVWNNTTIREKNYRRKVEFMIGEILATGDEIRTGALVDSNSALIAG